VNKLNYKDKFVRLGSKIRELRVSQNLTQQTLSSLCDLDVRTIQRIEKGQQNITLNILFNISNSLNVHPVELIKHCFGNL
jgi:transcriptional regulator with XRE-family HTH domain